MADKKNPFASSFDDGVPFKEESVVLPVSDQNEAKLTKIHKPITKTKRTTLVFSASLMKKTKKYCVENEISMTNFLSLLLEDYFKQNRRISDLQK